MSPTWHAPHIDYLAVAPMLVVFGAAVLGVGVEILVPQRVRHGAQLAVALAGLGGAFGTLLVAATRGATVTARSAIAVDGPTLFLQAAILVLSCLAVLLVSDRARAKAPDGETLPLLLFAVTGLLLMPAAHDLITLFVALEVLSLPLYVLCGLARHRQLLSQEASLKYFVLGGFSSAFYLYGAALVYGLAGATSFSDIATAAARPGPHPLLPVGLGLIAVALLFKIGAAPFHGWVPDVYQGAPTAVTGFMAAVTKVAAFGALLRLLAATGDLGGLWRPVLSAAAVLTMVVGAVLAVVQRDVKRMLGYSAISQAGFILLGVLGAGRAGVAGTLFYLAVYGFGTLGSFAVVTLVRDGDGDGEAGVLSAWVGLGRRSPLVAAALSLFLLTLAGIPLTSGFVGKFAVFSAAVAGGYTPLVVVAVLASAVAVFVYARLIMLMFFREPGHDGVTVVVPGALTGTVIVAGALATVLLGVLPQPLLGLAMRAAVFVH